MSEDHTAEREAFEAWYSAEDQETDDPERTYELTEEGMNELTKYCVWQGWQARAAAAASTAVSVSEPVFAFRRKGLDDFCTCTEKRYAELSAKPNLFETRIFYTTPPTQAADSVLEDAETALRKVLGVVQRYLPPDGPSAHDAMSEIIAIVDPWPLGPLEKP